MRSCLEPLGGMKAFVKPGQRVLLKPNLIGGFPAERVERRAPTTQPGAFTFPINDPRAAIDLLTGQWQEHRLTIARNVATQRQWFAQLEEGRQTLARQCRELTEYVSRASGQYRQALSELRAGR